jgi:hypothetical protein
MLQIDLLNVFNNITIPLYLISFGIVFAVVVIIIKKLITTLGGSEYDPEDCCCGETCSCDRRPSTPIPKPKRLDVPLA